MGYAPNTLQWRVGSLVIHSGDAKQFYMLMRVIGYDRNGLAITRYEYPDSLREGFPGREHYHNAIRYLLDPSDFDIQQHS